MSDSEPEPDPTALVSVKAKLKIAQRLIETASQQLLGPNVSASKRAELQKVLEDTREDMRRFQNQKRALKNQ